MTREEQIKQYCADQGFPYGACSGVSSVKAIVATEAIKWADEHPKGSVIKWQTGTPNEMCTCLVTIVGGAVEVADWDGVEWDSWLEDSIIAWCKLSDIEPYKEEKK